MCRNRYANNVNLMFFFQTSVNKTQTKSDELVVHIVELSSQNNAFILEIDSANVTTNVSIYGRQEKAPTLEEYDFSHKFPNISNKHRYFLGNGTITGIKYYIGVKSGVQMNYTFHSHEIGCYYYDEGNKSWTTYGCTVCWRLYYVFWRLYYITIMSANFKFQFCYSSMFR